MQNPFLSTPEATAFWREQEQACAEARRLLCKAPEFAAFLAAGGTITVISDGFPATSCFAVLLKDGDNIYSSIRFYILCGGKKINWLSQDRESVARLTAWLLAARDGAKPEIVYDPAFERPNAAEIAQATIAVEVFTAPKRLEAPKYDIHKAC